MLAWVHQSLASERELMVALFGEDTLREQHGATSGLRSEGSDTLPSGDMPHTEALLDRVFESICRPLKVGDSASFAARGHSGDTCTAPSLRAWRRAGRPQRGSLSGKKYAAGAHRAGAAGGLPAAAVFQP